MELVGSTELPGLGMLRFFRAELCGPVLGPGQELFGTIEFHCLKASMFVRGVWVKLMGRQSLSVGSMKATQLDLLEGQEDYYLGGFHDVLYGFGEEDESGGALFELREGVHQWNFAFKIPENAPPSYCDEYMDVSYTATVVFDSPEVPLAISQITHIAIVTASVLDATSSRILAAATCGDIDALGMRPSVAFASKKRSAVWGCMQADRSVSISTSDDVVAILDAVPERPVTSLDPSYSGTSSGSGLGRTRTRPSSHGAHTVLRLMLSKDDRNFIPSSSGSIAPVPVAFDFMFMETSVKVDCSIATVCTGKICLEARLIVCVNLRSDPARPFRSLRSLLQAPPSPASSSSAGPDDKADRGLRMHVLQNLSKHPATKTSAGAGVAGAVRRWLGRLTSRPPGGSEESEDATAEGWGACIVHPLWSRAVVLQAPEQPLTPVTVQLEVPVKIDPTVRSTCLADWPRPSPLRHQAHGAILNFTTRDTPLFQYRVLLEVAAYELKGDVDAQGTDKGARARAGLEKGSIKKQPLCQPCYVEVEINAPGPSTSRPASAVPVAGARRCRRAPGPGPGPGPFSPIPASAAIPASETASEAVAGVVAATVAVTTTTSLPLPRHRGSSASRRTVAPSLTADGIGETSRSSTGIAESGLEAGAGMVPVPPGRIRHRRRHDSEAARAALVEVVGDENCDPNIVGRSSIAVVAGKRKPQTPQARAVKSVPKIKAELVSRGPAAVLRDRTAPVHRDIQITPQRFAPAVPIAQGAVVVLDDTTSFAMGGVASVGGPAMDRDRSIADGHTNRPTSAHATTATASASTPDVEFRGTGMFSPGDGDDNFSPSQLTSPTLAFLCSPRTTEMLLQQEQVERAREDEERAEQEREARAAEVGGDDYSGSEDDDDGASSCNNSNYAGDDEVEAVAAEVTLDDLPRRRPPLAVRPTAVAAAAGGVVGGEVGPTTYTVSQTPHISRLALEDGVHPFQPPPDTMLPSGRVSDDVDGNMITGSPWVESGAAGVGIHFTHNGRRLSFSHPTEDLVSEFQPLPFNSPIPT